MTRGCRARAAIAPPDNPATHSRPIPARGTNKAFTERSGRTSGPFTIRENSNVRARRVRRVRLAGVELMRDGLGHSMDVHTCGNGAERTSHLEPDPGAGRQAHAWSRW
jgi:hypothetical protein